MPTRNDDATAAIMIEPASAVPIDAPRFVIVFWMPPTSGLWSSGTADTVTAPSCDASAPMPSPIKQHRHEDDLWPRVASSAPSSTTVPARSAKRPARTTSRGDAAGTDAGPRGAAINSVSESGSSRTPVSSAVSPRHTERYSGTTKNRPAWARNWKKNIIRPPFSCLLRSISARTSGSPPRACTRSSQRKKSQITKRPARTSHTPGESADPRRAVRLGLDPAPLARAQHAEHEQREAESRQHGADDVERRGRLSTGASAIRRVMRRIASTTTTSPAKTQRHEKYVVQKPADERADRDRDRARRGNESVGRGPPLGREVRRDERDDRRQDQRRADALEERPPEEQHRQVRRERGRRTSRCRRSRSRSRTPACGR